MNVDLCAPRERKRHSPKEYEFQRKKDHEFGIEYEKIRPLKYGTCNLLLGLSIVINSTHIQRVVLLFMRMYDL